jgi:hypothetical protein
MVSNLEAALKAAQEETQKEVGSMSVTILN